MSTYLKLPQSEDASGHRFAASHENGRAAAMFFPAPLLASKTFGLPVGALRSSTAIFTMGATAIMEGLSATGWVPQAPKQLGLVRRDAGALLREGREQKVELVKRREEWLRPVKRNVTDASRTEELFRQMREQQRNDKIRDHLQILKPGALMGAIFNNPEFASAVIEFPETSPVPVELTERLEDFVIEHNLTKRFAVHEQRKASATDLFAIGDNKDVARERAIAAMAAYKQDVEEVALVETVLNDTIDYISVVADVSRFAAFDMIAA